MYLIKQKGQVTDIFSRLLMLKDEQRGNRNDDKEKFEK